MSKDSRSNRDKAAALRAARARTARRRRWRLAGVLAIVLAVTVGGAIWYAGLDPTGQRTASSGGAHSGVPSGADGYGVVIGQPDAPTSAVIYEDFQCPVCKAFEDAGAQPMDVGIARGELRVEYRIVSFLDAASANQYSSRAANAAAAVLDTAGVEAFKEFHDTLFANQPAEGTLGPDNGQLIAWAVDSGADAAALGQLIQDGTFDQWVVDATDAMSKDGVNGTPTIVIDGRKLGAGAGLQRLQETVR